MRFYYSRDIPGHSEVFAVDLKQAREYVRKAVMEKGKHWAYMNVQFRLVDVAVDKKSVAAILNGNGLFTTELNRTWVVTPRGALKEDILKEDI